MAGWDWYATFASLAGVDPTDHRAAAAGLPPIDSLDMWPMLSGANMTSPRTHVPIGSNTGGESGRTSGNTTVGGLIVPPYKIILGMNTNDTLDMATWTGPQNPNMTCAHTPSCLSPAKMIATCGRTPATGCLYNVYEDPTEHVNLALKLPKVFNGLLARVDEIQKGVYSPQRADSAYDNVACNYSLTHLHGFWGPFWDV